MRINETIKKRRSDLNIDANVLASKCGISVHAYSDIEVDESEFYMVLSLRTIKILFRELDLDLIKVFNLEKCNEAVDNKWFCAKIENSKYSTAEISDKVGIYESSILDLMNDIKTISNWVMDAVLDLAKVLNVNPSCLLKMSDE